MGMTRQQAEALTVTITEVLCHNREKLAESYVSKAALEKVGCYLQTVSPPFAVSIQLHRISALTLIGCYAYRRCWSRRLGGQAFGQRC